MAGTSDNRKKTSASATTAKKGKGSRRKKGHPILLTVFLVLFSIFAAGMLTVVVVGTSMLSYVDNYVDGKNVVDLENYKNSQSQTSIMYAYDSDNNVVETRRLHGEENRIWVDYDKMPDNLLWAFICLEDKRFYEHSGVDWIRTIGVLVKPSLDGQGGSTITQQLIKNLTDQKDVTYVRKFNEILKALNLEKYYSKKDIIEAYLNTVCLGAGSYGVETAAETYFGKTVSELTLGECAMLAGITQAPYSYNPYLNYEKAVKRQTTCLDAMKAKGKITEKQYNKALKTKIKLVEQKTSTQTTQQTISKDEVFSWYEEYVIDQVISDLQAKYDYEYTEAWQMVYYGGLSIYSAVDMDIQKRLETIYENREGFPSSREDANGRLPQSSMTIMDYQGRIVALVGGTGEKTSNRAYNRATDYRAKRQPGSSIKPLSVYAPAIDMGIITPSSTILEKAITVDGKIWPRNFNGDHGSGGYITVQEALVRSLNTVPARIIKMLGTQTSLKYCNECFHLNLSQQDQTISALAIGGTHTGVTTLEMAAAFATFGNGGQYFKPYSYYKVTDRNGNTILDNTDNEPQQVIKNSTANSTLGMLTQAVVKSNGTGYGSKINNFQTFAKTGTTSDNCDKWYCGGTPHYVTAVWYGYDYPADLHTGSTNPSKTIFKYVFSEIHKNLPSKTFSDLAKEVGADPNAVGKIFTTEITDIETEPISETTTAEETTAEKTTAETEAPAQSTTKPPVTTDPTTTTKPTTTKPTTTTEPTTKAPVVTTAPTQPHTTTTEPVTEKPKEPDPAEPQEPESPEKPPVSEPEE